MKKRMFALVLALSLALTCALPAFAATNFDAGVLKNGKDIFALESDAMKGKTYSVQSLFETPESWNWYSEQLGVLVFPCVGECNGYAVFGLGVAYLFDESVANAEIDPQHVRFTVNGTRYSFSELTAVELPLDSTANAALEGRRARCAFVILDADTLSLMENLVKNREEAVSVHVEDAFGEWNFDLTQHETDSCVHLYNLFAQAGGLSKQNLALFSAGSGTKCEVGKASR